MARNRARNADRRAHQVAAPTSAQRLSGLRWVPVPLAVLLAALGWLVFGSVLGQHAFASVHEGPHAGGLGLSVNTMLWMDDDMANMDGAPAATGSLGTAKTGSGGFVMPASMMPGLKTVGDKRLRVEVVIKNLTTKPQQYALTEFSLHGKGHHSWALLQNGATRGQVLSAPLGVGFETTVDLYFDVPTRQAKHLTLQWSHGGDTVSIPVHIDDSGGMAGM